LGGGGVSRGARGLCWLQQQELFISHMLGKQA
jgi:hypothetical protein